MIEFMHFVRDESGANAIEYALIATLIAIAILGAVTLVGTEVNNDFTSVANSF